MKGNIMNCPVCSKVALEAGQCSEIPQKLHCPQCGGQWVQAFQYWKWLHALGTNLPEKPAQPDEKQPTTDSTKAKLCPECGHFLTRNKVGHGIEFHIDRCTTCGGIWFDKNEWDILKSRNLHDDIHFIFSEAWQHNVAQQENKETHEKRIQMILGDNDYAKVHEFKQWADTHAMRSTIMAFLAGLDG